MVCLLSPASRCCRRRKCRHHAGSAKKTAAGMTRLAQSCDDCHAVFHKAAGNAADK